MAPEGRRRRRIKIRRKCAIGMKVWKKNGSKKSEKKRTWLRGSGRIRLGVCPYLRDKGAKDKDKWVYDKCSVLI